MRPVFLIIFSLLLLFGCSPTLESDSESTSVIVTTGTLVDPYIQGAKMYADLNQNSTYDAGEPLSSVSDSSGSFQFNVRISEGVALRIHTPGTHNGVAYERQLSGYAGSKNVVSPITTLLTKGLSKEEVVQLLADAGVEIIADELDSDPVQSFQDTGQTELVTASLAIDLVLDKIGDEAAGAEIIAEVATLEKSVTMIKGAFSQLNANQDANVQLSAITSLADYGSDRLVAGDTAVFDQLTQNDSATRTILLNELADNYQAGTGEFYQVDENGSVELVPPIEDTTTDSSPVPTPSPTPIPTPVPPTPTPTPTPTPSPTPTPEPPPTLTPPSTFSVTDYLFIKHTYISLTISDDGNATRWCLKDDISTNPAPSVEYSDQCFASTKPSSYTLSGSGTRKVWLIVADDHGSVSVPIAHTVYYHAPPDPTLTITDQTSGSTMITDSRTVDIVVGNDSQAFYWCVSEVQETQPSSGDPCLGGSGPSNGWYAFLNEPTTFQLSSDNGSKTVYVWVRQAAGEVSAGQVSVNITLAE